MEHPDRRLKGDRRNPRPREGALDVRVISMQKRDLPEMLRIEAASFSRPWTAEMFRREFSETMISGCMVAKEGGDPSRGDAERVLGYVCFWAVWDEMQIANLAVHPRDRRRGIGGLLLQEALHLGRSRGVTRVTLEVRASNEAAQRLYQRFGFQIVGARKGYYQFPHEDAWVMGLDMLPSCRKRAE